MPPPGPTPEEIQALNDAIKELSDTRANDLEVIRAMNRARGKETDLISTQVDLLDKQAEASRNAAADMAELLAKAQQSNNAATAAYNNVTEQMEKLQKQKREGIELNKEEEASLKRLEELYEGGPAQILQNARALQEQQQALAENIERQAQLANNSNRLATQFDNVLRSTLNLNAKWRDDGLAGSMAAVLTGGADMGMMLEGMADKFASLANPVELLGKLLTNTFKQVQELGDLAAQLRQLTGEGREMNKVFLDVRRSTMMYGLSAIEAKEAVSALYTEFAGFSALSKEAQADLAAYAGQLKLFGLETRDVAQAQDFLQMSLQMTDTEAKQTQTDMIALGKALKVPPSIIMRDFAAAQNVIGQFGKEGMKVFEQLSAQAKATGVELQGLLGVAAGFDTFEDAADKVGSLNAMLGGAYFDTMQMVSATEAERIELLRQGIEASGDQWTTLDRFEKKAIMSAAGITDMTEANKLFGNSIEAYYEQEAAAAVASGSIANLSDAAKENMTITEKLTAIGNRMAFVVDGLIDVFDGFTDGILSAMAVMEPLFVAFEFILGILGWLIAPLGKVISFLGVMFIAFKAIGAIISVVGAAIASPFLLIGLKIAAVIAAVRFLYELFTEGPGFIGDFIDDAGDLLGKGINYITDFADSAYEALEKFADSVGEFFTKSMNFIMELGGEMLDFFMALPGRVITAVSETIDSLGNFIREALVFIFGENIGNALADFGKNIFNAITWPFRAAKSLVSGFINMVSSGFEGVGDMISGVFNNVLDFVKAPFNIILKGVNAVIRALNTMSFTIPEWVPMIGGNEFGFNIAEIPALETGGVIEQTGVALVHAGETVTPAKKVPGSEGGANQLLAKIDELITAVAAGATTRTPTTTGGRNEVVLEVDGQRLGKVIYESFLKDKIEPILDTGA